MTSTASRAALDTARRERFRPFLVLLALGAAAARGSRTAWIRVRIISVVVVLAVVVVVSIPGFLPPWGRVEQGVCGGLVLPVAILVNLRRTRALFPRRAEGPVVMDPRWGAVLAVAPYLVLATVVAFTIGIEWGEPARLGPELGLCAAYAVWVLVLRTLGLAWTRRPAVVAVFLAGAILLNLLLVLREGWFGFLAIATFTFAFSLAAWPWELLAVGATAVVAGIAQSSSIPRDTGLGLAATAVVILLDVVVMCGTSWGQQLASGVTERAGVETERARLAREIHDTLAQGFAGIVIQLQAAEQAEDEAARRRHADAALGLAREGLAEARRSVQALRPAALDAMRLPGALDSAARAWSARTGIPVAVRIEGERALSTEAEVALLRTAQEALANVERHADARRVKLTLRCAGGATRLEVRDDGRGFSPGLDAPADGGGFGLVAMRERLEGLAGRLLIESRPGGGTAVRAEVPA